MTVTKKIEVHAVRTSKQHYEGYDVLLSVHATQAGAKRKVVLLQEYDKTRPGWPPEPCTDKAYDSFWAKLKRWQKKHPAGPDNSDAGSYVIDTRTLED
jgi:hypothetical protein